MNATKERATIERMVTASRTIRLPKDFPLGRVRITVLPEPEPPAPPAGADAPGDSPDEAGAGYLRPETPAPPTHRGTSAGMDETDYLMSDPANHAYLMDGIADLDAGRNTVTFTLDEFRQLRAELTQ